MIQSIHLFYCPAGDGAGGGSKPAKVGTNHPVAIFKVTGDSIYHHLYYGNLHSHRRDF
jgi:hypothetical protein